MHNVLTPASLAFNKALFVSVVSPDCVIKMYNIFSEFAIVVSNKNSLEYMALASIFAI